MIIEDPRPRREEASPVLFVHGFLGEPADWDVVIAAMRRPRRVLRANLLGRDGSRSDIDALAAELAEGVRRQGLAPLSVVGYSLGGRVTLALADAHPMVVRRAIAVSASLGIDDPLERAERAAADARLAATLLADGLAPFVDRWYSQPLFASLRVHPAFPAMRARRAAGDAAAWAAILRDASPGASPSLWPALPKLAAGVSLAVGELDAKYSAQSAEAARRAPELRVDVVEGAGHAIHLERPTALAALVDELLD